MARIGEVYNESLIGPAGFNTFLQAHRERNG
jgi:hypothetical protein